MILRIIQIVGDCNLNLYLNFVEETVSLESPPPEANNHNLGELLSQVLPEDEIRRNAAVAALAAAAEQKQLEMAAAGMSFQQRAPGSQLRNGSMTVKLKSFYVIYTLFCGYFPTLTHN